MATKRQRAAQRWRYNQKYKSRVKSGEKNSRRLRSEKTNFISNNEEE